MSDPVFSPTQLQELADLFAKGITSTTINGRTVNFGQGSDLLKRIQYMQNAQAAAAGGSTRGNARRSTFRR